MPKKSRKVRAKRTVEIADNVGDRMRTWRRASGLSLEAVAAKIGTSRGHLSEAETGLGNLSLPLFIKFCAAIKTPSSRILEDRMLPKNRDFERTARDLREKLGNQGIQWLATLTREEARLALLRAREVVELHRLRNPSNPVKGSTATVVTFATQTDEEASVPERLR